jgi:hypothetical protein
MIRSQKVLRHAKGQPCSARFPGICNGNPETTVFCHLNGAAFGKGMGVKAHDVLGFFGCSDCHMAYDLGHGTKDWLAGDMHKLVLEAVCTTWIVLIRDGIVIVPLDPERLSSERQVAPRKPKSERARVPSNPDRKIPSRPMRAKERT